MALEGLKEARGHLALILSHSISLWSQDFSQSMQPCWEKWVQQVQRCSGNFSSHYPVAPWLAHVFLIFGSYFLSAPLISSEMSSSPLQPKGQACLFEEESRC